MSIKEKFISSCKAGDLDKIQELFKQLPQMKISKTQILEEGARYAAQSGHVNIVSGILDSLGRIKQESEFAQLKIFHEIVLFDALKADQKEVVRHIVIHENELDFNFDLRRRLRNADNINEETKQYLGKAFEERSSHNAIPKNNETLKLVQNDKLFLACADGDFAQIDKLLNAYLSTDSVNADLNAQDDYAFRIAATLGNMELVKRFIFDMNIEKSEHIKKHLEEYPNEDINHYFNARDLGKVKDKEINQYMVDVGSQDVLDKQLVVACDSGNLAEVKRLLTSTEIPKNANIQSHNNQAFLCACSKGHLEVVKYILTSTELKEHANISTHNGIALSLAGKSGNLELVSFLTTPSEQMKQPLDIQMNNNELFKNADVKLSRYLVFDANLPLNDSIREILAEKKSEEIDNMFKVRELNEMLASKLSSPSFNIADTLKKIRESNQNTVGQKNTM